jgi:hypothetical protein
MTAWQDQPPLGNQQLSRRQVRQNERGDAVDVAPTPAEQADFAGFPREGWDTEARRVAATTQAQRPEDPQAATRRSQRSLQAVEPQAPEPLNYATQGRPQTQNPDGQQLRRRSASTVDGQQPQDAAPQQSSPSYRVRDFSPEGRRTSFSSTTPVEAAAPEDLQYRTQGSPAQVAPSPAPIERTLSRRELRALQNAQAPAASIPAPPELVEPPRLRERNRQLSTEQDYRTGDALAEFAALTGQVAAPVAPQYPAPDFPPPAPQQQAVPAQTDPEPAVQQQQAPREPSTYTPPTGHWSTQAMIDDDEQFQENTLSRNVGATSGAITTSVLVLPSLPSEDALRPLGSTGEILLTGTIDLPRSLGSTGAHPERYEHPDVDAFLERGDREDSAPDSAPVRAISAVSTHTSTRNVMEAKKSKGNSRLPVILAVAATAMAVGVVVLVVGGLVFGIL